jgi:hypothetical protein
VKERGLSARKGDHAGQNQDSEELGREAQSQEPLQEETSSAEGGEGLGQLALKGSIPRTEEGRPVGDMGL